MRGRVLIVAIALCVCLVVYSQRDKGRTLEEGVSHYCYAQEIRRDPFENLLPKEAVPDAPETQEAIVLPPTEIQGVLWGTQTPRVIINEDVYKIGDSIPYPETEGVLFKIEKNIVYIMYRGKLFKRGVTK